MDFSWFYDINNWGPYMPAIIGIVIGGWLFLKKNRQTRCTSKTEGIITGEHEIITGTNSSQQENVLWQATYSFEADGKTYEAAANKHGEIRFKRGDAVTVNYDARDPARNFIEQDRVKSSYGWIFIIGGVVVSALFIILPRIL